LNARLFRAIVTPKRAGVVIFSASPHPYFRVCTVDKAQAIAADESAPASNPYGRTAFQVTLDEIERKQFDEVTRGADRTMENTMSSTKGRQP
jgi:hypothetical protein